MSTDGPVKAELSGGSNSPLTNEQPVELGYTAGCKALDSLEKLINCTENLFHPNAGAGEWTLAVSNLFSFRKLYTYELLASALFVPFSD